MTTLTELIETKLDYGDFPFFITYTDVAGCQPNDLLPFARSILRRYNDEDAEYYVERVTNGDNIKGISIGVVSIANRRASTIVARQKRRTEESYQRLKADLDSDEWSLSPLSCILWTAFILVMFFYFYVRMLEIKDEQCKAGIYGS